MQQRFEPFWSTGISTHLHQLYNAHNKICQVKIYREGELNVGGARRNLGTGEIAITEKYDIKGSSGRLTALVAQQSAHQTDFTGKPYANAFAMLQGTRVQTG